MINIVNNLLYANSGHMAASIQTNIWSHIPNEGVMLNLGLITGDFYLLFTVDLGL